MFKKMNKDLFGQVE